jgi:hypothetical protein
MNPFVDAAMFTCELHRLPRRRVRPPRNAPTARARPALLDGSPLRQYPKGGDFRLSLRGDVPLSDGDTDLLEIREPPERAIGHPRLVAAVPRARHHHRRKRPLGGLSRNVHDAIETGDYDFARNTKEYFRPLLGYTALVWVVLLLSFGVGAVFPPLLFVALPMLLVLNYLFYGVPFLVVVDDRSLGKALRRSNRLARGESNTDTTYASFGIGYLVFVFVASIVGTLFINLGILGVVVSAVVSAPVALALTVATVEFFIDVRHSSSESLSTM